MLVLCQISHENNETATQDKLFGHCAVARGLLFLRINTLGTRQKERMRGVRSSHLKTSRASHSIRSVERTLLILVQVISSNTLLKGNDTWNMKLYFFLQSTFASVLMPSQWMNVLLKHVGPLEGVLQIDKHIIHVDRHQVDKVRTTLYTHTIDATHAHAT